MMTFCDAKLANKDWISKNACIEKMPLIWMRILTKTTMRVADRNKNIAKLLLIAYFFVLLHAEREIANKKT